jgi:serine/threonine protein kinase
LFEEVAGETLTSSLVGSLGYIPTEVTADPKIRTARHDVYSCGVILYEIIAGRRPDPRAYQNLSLTAKPLGKLDSIVLRAIAPAQERYQSVSEFMKDLRELRREWP